MKFAANEREMGTAAADAREFISPRPATFFALVAAILRDEPRLRDTLFPFTLANVVFSPSLAN